jgi:hypothetical protein
LGYDIVKDINIDEFCEFRFYFDKIEIVDLLSESESFILESPSLEKFDKMIIVGKFIGNSRIDGYPMMVVDSNQLDRNDKIDNILNS